MKWAWLAACLIAHASSLVCPVKAQMVTEIKVVAVQEFSDLKAQAVGYSGADGEALDFRKGRGGGYVFAIFKNELDTSKYITDVKVTADRKLMYGMPFSEGGKDYTPAVFYQEEKDHKDDKYKGGLNGRNYRVYGGAYEGQPHVYVSRTGNTDFKNKVLQSAYVSTSMPKELPTGWTYSGGHGGGGRYFVFQWHTHDSKYRATGDINTHQRYCSLESCGLVKLEDHRFAQRYGNDVWGQLPKTDPRCDEYHYKKCLDCGQIVPDKHQFATYVADWKNHNKRCLNCNYVIDAGHSSFGKQKFPVDEYNHVIYCDSCGFLKQLPHDYSTNRHIERQDCEHALVKYTCSQCYHQAFLEEKGTGHDYDVYGICRTANCLHPYEMPDVERLGNGSDSVFVVKSFGNLYWISEYVNNRRPKTNIRLANDLVAEDFMRLPWRPIGATDSTAFQGTFDGGGHVISMLQTEVPVAGCGNRGLFGTIAKGAVVKDVSLAACNMRGWNYIGAVAGVNNGTINNCHVVFSLIKSIGTGMNLGGICGLNRGTISGCSTANSVWVGGVRDYAGGICGTNEGGSLSGNKSAAICGSGSDAVLPETASEH